LAEQVRRLGAGGQDYRWRVTVTQSRDARIFCSFSLQP